MSVIFSRAPLRISPGGGGTDLPSYYREHDGFLVSGAIDKYVYMLTHTVFQRRYLMKYTETESVEQNAREKLQKKDADLIVANDVSDASIGFDADQNEVIVIARDGSSTKIARAPKSVVANRILDLVVANLSS